MMSYFATSLFCLLSFIVFSQNNVVITGEIGDDVAIDTNGHFKTHIELDRPQALLINYIMPFRVYLKPNDSLHIRLNTQFSIFEDTKGGVWPKGITPKFSGIAAKINQFLYEVAIHGRHSLLEKPLFKNMDREQYFGFIDDLTASAWHSYQTTQDNTDEAQNDFVYASLRGQNYLRKKAFYGNEFLKDDQEIPFKLIENDNALYSPNYIDALRFYVELYHFGKAATWEKDDEIGAQLNKTPKIKEELLATRLSLYIKSDVTIKSWL